MTKKKVLTSMWVRGVLMASLAAAQKPGEAAEAEGASFRQTGAELKLRMVQVLFREMPACA